MRLRLSIALSLVFCCLSAAQAETFSIYKIGKDDTGIVGIDASGVVLLANQSGGCNGLFDPYIVCYTEVQQGVTISRSDFIPSDFVFDNGTPCAAPNYGYHGVCNNGFEVYGEDGDYHDIREIFPNSDPNGVLVLGGSDDLLFVNSSGDFVVADGESEYTFQVLVQTPEPSSFALLGTGLFGVAGLLKRRFAN